MIGRLIVLSLLLTATAARASSPLAVLPESRLIETVAGGCSGLPAVTDGAAADRVSILGLGALAVRGPGELLFAEGRSVVFGVPQASAAPLRSGRCLTRRAGVEVLPESCALVEDSLAGQSCLASRFDNTPAVRGLAADAAGNLYISNSRVHASGLAPPSQRVLRVDAMTQRVTTLAGGGATPASTATALATHASFTTLGAIAFRPPAALVVVDAGDNRIWQVGLHDGRLRLLAGVGAAGGSGEQSGIATREALALVTDVAVDVTGTIWVAERAETPAGAFGVISALDPVAGTLSPPRLVGSPIRALAVAPDGTLVFSTAASLRLVRPGAVSAEDLAGSEQPVGLGDNGRADQARVAPHDVVIGADGSIYFADLAEERVRRVFARRAGTAVDPAVTSLETGDRQVRPGARMGVLVTLSNSGAGDLAARGQVAVSLAPVDGTTPVNLGLLDIEPLEPGVQQRFSRTFVVPPQTPPGGYLLRAETDVFQRLPQDETARDNDSFTGCERIGVEGNLTASVTIGGVSAAAVPAGTHVVAVVFSEPIAGPPQISLSGLPGADAGEPRSRSATVWELELTVRQEDGVSAFDGPLELAIQALDLGGGPVRSVSGARLVRRTGAPTSDLVPLSIAVTPRYPTTRDILSVDVSIANAGAGASGAATLTVLVDGRVAVIRPLAPIAPFGDTDLPMVATLPPLPAGPHTIELRLATSEEPRIANNTLSIVVTVSASASATLVADTVAGTGLPFSSPEAGAARAVGLFQPSDVAASGGRLFIAEAVGVRELDLRSGEVRRLAGSATALTTGEGVPALETFLPGPEGLALLRDGRLAIASPLEKRLRLLDRSLGLIGTWPGGALSETGLTPTRVATTPTGDLVFTTREGFVARLSPDGMLQALAFRGPASLAGIAVESSGAVIFAETQDQQSVLLSLEGGTPTTIAGGGDSTEPPAAALDFRFSELSGVAIDPSSGDVLVADRDFGRIYRIVRAGNSRGVELVAGTFAPSGPGDGGPARDAQLRTPLGVSADPERPGILYVAEFSANRIRRITDRGRLGLLDDPDDVTGSARALVAGGGPVAGEVLPARDADAFRFEAIAGRSYSAAVTLAGLSDSVLALFGLDRVTMLAENDDVSPGDRASRIRRFTASQTGTHYLVVRGRDATDSGGYRVEVRELEPLAISLETLPPARIGSRYDRSLASTGGASPVTWSVAAGSLPAGLVLDPATGRISGFPLASAPAAAVSFRATDASGVSTERALVLGVDDGPAPAPLAVVTPSLPLADVGLAYRATLEATGGVEPYVWTAIGLPAGLTATADGRISGRPESSFEGTIAARVTDLAASSVERSVPLTVSSARPRPAVTLGPVLPADGGEAARLELGSLGSGFEITTVVVAVEFDPGATRFVGVAPLELATGDVVPIFARVTAPGRVEIVYSRGVALTGTGGLARLVFAAIAGGPGRRFPPIFAGVRFESAQGEVVFVAPEARAGADQIVELRRGAGGAVSASIPDITDPSRLDAFVRLDGRASSDSNLPRSSVTYEWRLTTGPAAVALSNPRSPTPTFVPPAGGTYEFSLVLRNRGAESPPSVTRVVVQEIGGNSPPAAIPVLRNLRRERLNVSSFDPPPVVEAGEPLELEGLASTDPDPLDASSLRFEWAQTEGPALLDANARRSSAFGLTPSTPAAYAYELTVTDAAGARSRPAQVAFRVVPAGFSRFLSGQARGKTAKTGGTLRRASVPAVTFSGRVDTPVVLRADFSRLVDKAAFAKPPLGIRFSLARGPSAQALPSPVLVDTAGRLAAELVFTPPRPGGYRFTTQLVSGDPAEGKVADGPELDLVAEPARGAVPDAVIAVTTELRSFSTLPATRVQDRDALQVRAGSVVTLDASQSSSGAAAGDRLEYKWTKLAGSDEVVLSHAASPVVTFAAPAAAGQNVELSLEVTRVDGESRIEGLPRRVSLRTVSAERAVVTVRLERGVNLLAVPVRPFTTGAVYTTRDLALELGADFVAWPVEESAGGPRFRFRATLRDLRGTEAPVSGRLPYLVGHIRRARVHTFVGAGWPASAEAGVESAFGLTQIGGVARDALAALQRGRAPVPFQSTGSWFDRFDEDLALVGPAIGADGVARLAPVFPSEEDGRLTPRQPLNQPHNAYLRLRRP